MIKKIMSKIIPLHIKKQLINFKILAIDYGQYYTIKYGDCLDRYKNEIPWYTYPAIEWLSNIDFSQKSVFEYGSGNSSIYWAKRANFVVSIEHDKKWYEKIKSSLKENQILLFRENNEEYEKSILCFDKKFDLIIIDGIRRFECAKIIKDRLNYESDEGFLIILDNSDWYIGISKYLREELNLIQIDFHGFGPINNYTWTTSVFLSRNFNFKPIENIQPHFSIAAIKHREE